MTQGTVNEEPAGDSAASRQGPRRPAPQITGRDTEVETLKTRIAELTAAVAERDERLSTRGKEIDTLVVQLAALERIIASLERAIEEVRAEGRQRSAQAAHSPQDAFGSSVIVSSEWSEIRPVLETRRERTIDDVRRASASRAWRLGHGMTRFFRALTFRRSARGAGALEVLLERLEAEELPPSSTGQDLVPDFPRDEGVADPISPDPD